MMVRRRLIGFVRAAPGPVLLTTIAGLATLACLAAQGILLALTMRDALDGVPAADLTGRFWAIAALVVTAVLLRAARDAAAAWTAAQVKRRVRDQLLAALLALGPGGMTTRRTADVQATITDGVEALQAYVGRYLPQALIAVIAPLVLIAGMFVLDPVVGGIVLVAAIVVPLAQPLCDRLLGARGNAHWRAYRRLAARMHDALQGMTTLKMLDATEEHGRAVREDAQRLYRATVGNLVASLAVYSIVALALGAGTALAVGVGALRAAFGHLDALAVLLVLFLAAECFRPLLELQQSWAAGFRGTSAAEGIFALLDAEPAVRDHAGPSPAAGTVTVTPSVAFEGVTFTYPGGERSAVLDVHLRVAAGETLALVGRSGAGKSTLVALLQRWFDPDVGRVAIGGVDLRDLPLVAARGLVAVVSQDVHLFAGSVADNLRLARPTASQAEVEAAARAARAHDFIVRLPQGYATPVGERGSRLSGGERQRVAIARALLADAPVLVLDEATSSVDGEAEAAIQDALADLVRGRTTLLIAHRLATVTSADRVAVMERGRIVEQGPPDALQATGGAYAALVRAQVAGR